MLCTKHVNGVAQQQALLLLPPVARSLGLWTSIIAVEKNEWCGPEERAHPAASAAISQDFSSCISGMFFLFRCTYMAVSTYLTKHHVHWLSSIAAEAASICIPKHFRAGPARLGEAGAAFFVPWLTPKFPRVLPASSGSLPHFYLMSQVTKEGCYFSKLLCSSFSCSVHFLTPLSFLQLMC